MHPCVDIGAHRLKAIAVGKAANASQCCHLANIDEVNSTHEHHLACIEKQQVLISRMHSKVETDCCCRI
jgi:hypothetical protein